MTWRTALRRPTFLIPVGVALLIGIVWLVSAISAAQPKTLDERTLEVARQIQCPVCNGESVADSPALKAAEMRGVIRQQLSAGALRAAGADVFQPGLWQRYFGKPATAGVYFADLAYAALDADRWWRGGFCARA